MAIKNNWCYLASEQVLKELDTNLTTGLDKTEARQRQDLHGPNCLLEKPPKSPWLLLFNQFKGFLILVMIGAAVLAGVFGNIKDALVFSTTS